MKKFSLAVLVFFAAGSFHLCWGQWYSSAVVDCPPKTWVVALGGQYAELNWQEKLIHAFERQGLGMVAFAVHPHLKLFAGLGYKQSHFAQGSMDEIRFTPDFLWGGGALVGPFNLVRDRVLASGLLFGEWYNPYQKSEKINSRIQSNWREIREYILESMRGGAGVQVTLRTKVVDFFAGPLLSLRRFRLKHLFSAKGGDVEYELERFSRNINSNLVVGVLLGFGFRLPGRYYLNIEIKNDNLNELMTFISLAQFGSP